MNLDGGLVNETYFAIEECLEKCKARFNDRLMSRAPLCASFANECFSYMNSLSAVQNQLLVDVRKRGMVPLENALKRLFDCHASLESECISIVGDTLGTSDTKVQPKISHRMSEGRGVKSVVQDVSNLKERRKNEMKWKRHVYMVNQGATSVRDGMVADQLMLEKEAREVIKMIEAGTIQLEDLSEIKEPFLATEICRLLAGDVVKNIKRSQEDYESMEKMLSVNVSEIRADGMGPLGLIRQKLAEFHSESLDLRKQLKNVTEPNNFIEEETKVYTQLDTKTREFYQKVIKILSFLVGYQKSMKIDMGTQYAEPKQRSMFSNNIPRLVLPVYERKSDVSQLELESPSELSKKVIELEELVGKLYEELAVKNEMLKGSSSRRRRSQRVSQNDKLPLIIQEEPKSIIRNSTIKADEHVPSEHVSTQQQPPLNSSKVVASKVDVNQMTNELRDLIVESVGVYYGMRGKLEIDANTFENDTEIAVYNQHLRDFVAQFNADETMKIFPFESPKGTNDAVSGQKSVRQAVHERLSKLPIDSWRFSKRMTCNLSRASVNKLGVDFVAQQDRAQDIRKHSFKSIVEPSTPFLEFNEKLVKGMTSQHDDGLNQQMFEAKRNRDKLGALNANKNRKSTNHMSNKELKMIVDSKINKLLLKQSQNGKQNAPRITVFVADTFGLFEIECNFSSILQPKAVKMSKNNRKTTLASTDINSKGTQCCIKEYKKKPELELIDHGIILLQSFTARLMTYFENTRIQSNENVYNDVNNTDNFVAPYLPRSNQRRLKSMSKNNKTLFQTTVSKTPTFLVNSVTRQRSESTKKHRKGNKTISELNATQMMVSATENSQTEIKMSKKSMNQTRYTSYCVPMYAFYRRLSSQDLRISKITSN